jgi:adenylate cyclase
MRRKLLRGLLIGLGSAAVALALWRGGALDRGESVTWAWRVRHFARRAAPADAVKVVLLDQASLDWGKQENGWSWPWPREVYRAVVDFCLRGGAKAVAFDVLFTEPSVYGVEDDEALGAAIRRAGPFVGAVFLGRQSGSAERWPADVPASPLLVRGLGDWLDANRGRAIDPLAAFPIPEVATNAAVLANVSDVPDEDGVFRRASLFRVFDGRAVPSLGLAAWCAANPGAELAMESGWMRVGGRRVPMDSDARAILRFRGPNGTHESFGAAAVVQSEIRLQSGEPPVLDPSVFRDRYVFFGFSAPGLLDLRPTPMSRVYPGVEIHATLLDNLLDGSFLRDPSRAAVFAATILLALACGVAGVSCRRAGQSVATFALFLPLPAAAGFAAYAAGWWWPVVVGETAAALSLVGAVVVNYATEGRQKAFIKSAFRYYVGAEVIEQMIADPSRLQLGGEKRELTLFFSDIEKFSSFSETLDPGALTALLNDYLSDLSAIIKEEGGYLDKYVGDAIVAFWNAPLPQPDHAVRACRAALRCQRKLDERRAEFQARTGASVRSRIGLHTGEVVVGNMGSRDRFNYTVLGDAANLASRLEGANKAFGSYLLVSESTWRQTGGTFHGRELGRVRVVGRQAPVRVYEVVGLAGEPRPEWLDRFEAGLRQCGEGRWREALEVFEALPDDPASARYAGRCRSLLAEPGSKWDGVWSLTEK